jgi:Cytochrome c7 and related cytochrome c
MAQVFDRSSNALARMSLVLTGLIVIALGVALNELQRSPWVTRQGQRPDQPIPFSHKHHVEGLGLQCQYCHTQVEKAAYAGIPPTKTCINCHSQIWTNAEYLEPVRESWATGASIQWIRVHDLPDYVYFSHDIHVNKGIGCASCHGRVDEMPLMYQQNTLQMEWCLNCHRNPAVNLRPTSEIYNMAWEGPSSVKPVWCGSTGKGGPTASAVACTETDPNKSDAQLVSLESGPAAGSTAPASYQKFTSQIELGKYLMAQYHIRTANELSSCETCHR